MHRCLSVLLLAPALTLIDAAVAQTLDLDGAAPAPPSLGLGTYAADLSRLLRQEMKDIAATNVGRDPVARTIALTSIKFRDLAVRLLDGGDDAGWSGSTAVLVGVRLVRGRGEIDALLDRVTGPDYLEGPAHAALRRYVEPGHAWSTEPDPDDPAALDAALAEHLEPLAMAVRLLVPGETANHWITASQVRQGSQRPAEPAVDELLGVLVGMADTTGLSDDGGVALRRVLEILQRGASFEQFGPQVREYAILLIDALGLWTEVDAATWLTAVQRGTCHGIITAAIVQVSDKQTSHQGVDRLRRLADSRQIIRRISQLHGTGRAAAPGRSRRDAPKIDMEPVTRAFGAVVTAAGDNPGDGSPQVDRLAAILEGINNPKLSLLFFGNFYKKTLDDYLKDMTSLLSSRDAIYEHLTIDIYNQGKILSRKYKLLGNSYSIFMFGISLCVIAYLTIWIVMGI